MTTSNVRAAVLASFAADSLALGAHWIYDTRKIKELFGRVEDLHAPASGSFHTARGKGEFTHYGDQMLVLLESVAARKAFDPKDFSGRWRALFDGYDGYVDQATRKTLSQYAVGKTWEEAGSPSNDLAGAARMAPLLCPYREDKASLLISARDQTRMTHRDPTTIDGAEFFARLAYDVLHGARPVEAIKALTDENFGNSRIAGWVREGLDSVQKDSVSVISGFGQSCHTPEAFPGVIHLLVKYEDDLREALIQCVMAGGDSAGRGMLVGMVLGAYLGDGALPEEWVSGLRRRDHILGLLEELV